MKSVQELDYVEGAGPGIPELSGAPPGGVPPSPPGLEHPDLERPKWDQETIEQFLRGTGAGIHMLAGVSERDWLMTEKDLERIGPPLTRICNRYEPVLKLAPVADPLLVAHGFGLYGWRSALERQRALRDMREETVEPDAGYEAGPAAEPDQGSSSNGNGELTSEDVLPPDYQSGPRYFDQ